MQADVGVADNVTVFRTGDLMDADAVADALHRKGIPFFRRAETFSGLEVAMPATPAPGIGMYWIIRVPAELEREATEVIRALPYRPRPSPSVPHGPSKSRAFAWVPPLVALFLAAYAGLYIYSCFARR